METIKGEKKAEYETIWQLMKGLIDKGRIPRGYNEVIHTVYDVRHKMIGLYEDDGKEYFELVYKKSLRELVSKESGLWQFVCENGMVAEKSEGILYRYDDYKYRLTNCSLKDESELEDFLLNSIKLD